LKAYANGNPAFVKKQYKTLKAQSEKENRQIIQNELRYNGKKDKTAKPKN